METDESDAHEEAERREELSESVPSFVSSASKSFQLFPSRKVACTLVSLAGLILTHMMHLSGLRDRLMEDAPGAP